VAQLAGGGEAGDAQAAAAVSGRNGVYRGARECALGVDHGNGVLFSLFVFLYIALCFPEEETESRSGSKSSFVSRA
jgi:hypothetical protein